MKKLNPHNWITKIKPHPETDKIIWKCQYCGIEDTYDALLSTECSYVYPPCPWCNRTPLCDQDCPGISMALRGDLSDTPICVIKE